MQPFIILHSNDIHGRIEGLARIATLVERVRAAHPDEPILYCDLGDVEESSVRLSALSKGAAMHRLLRAAGCQVAAVGNGGPMRYGPQVLPDYAAAGGYPLLLANLCAGDGGQLPGTQPAALLPVGALRLGLIGLTAADDLYDSFGLRSRPAAPLVRELAADLRRRGAGAVVVLSHMGLPDDRRLAAEAQDDIDLIVGAHTHNLLPAGEWAGRVLIAQAGEYAQHLGRLDLEWDGARLAVRRATVLEVGAEVPPSPRVLAEVAAIEGEERRFLDEIIGELAEPLDLADDRECGTGDLAADALRARMDGEVGVAAAGQAFTGPLPAGPLRRGALWDVCSSTANPGVATLSGAQLAALVARGLDPAFAAERPRPMRGQARGLLHLSGAEVRAGTLLIGGHPVEPGRAYRVAGTDWELEGYGGYVDPAWGLRPRYDIPTIMREMLEDYFRGAGGPVRVMRGRVDGSLG